MASYVLIMGLCFGINNKCMDPITPSIIFKDYYTCITYGYELSNQLLIEMKPNSVNTKKTYFKFTCIDQTKGV